MKIKTSVLAKKIHRCIYKGQKEYGIYEVWKRKPKVWAMGVNIWRYKYVKYRVSR